MAKKSAAGQKGAESNAVNAATLQQAMAKRLALGNASSCSRRSPSQTLTLDPEPHSLATSEWAHVHEKAHSSGRTIGICAICRGAFGTQQQALLSCGHAFHATCIRSLERWAKWHRICPLCRTEEYKKRAINDSALDAKRRGAVTIQTAWRRHSARNWYLKARSSIIPQSSHIGIGTFEDMLHNETDRLAHSVEAAEDEIDKLFAEIVLRQQMHYYEREDAHLQLHTGLLEQGPPSCELDQDQCQDLKEESAFIDWNAWSPVFKRALEREEGDQSGSSCVICFSSLSQNTEHGIALLSCSRRASLFVGPPLHSLVAHVPLILSHSLSGLHAECHKQFRRFAELFGRRSCPVCRQEYDFVLL